MNAPTGSGQVKVDLGGNPDIYLARVDWTPDGSAHCWCSARAAIRRRSTCCKVDPATGKSTVLFTEKSGTRSWLNLSATPTGR